MNEGWTFAHEYESYNNIQRRLFIANPLHRNTNVSSVRRLINQHIFEHIEKSLTHSKRTEYRYTGVQRNCEHVPDIFIPRRFSLENSIDKQCPECAKMVFHCDIYNFQWVSHCPFHGIEMTTLCPFCQCCWPEYSPYSYQHDLDNHCLCCGIMNAANSDLTTDYKLRLSKAIKPEFDILDLYLSNTIEFVTDCLGEEYRNMVALESIHMPTILSFLAPAVISSDFCDTNILIDKMEFQSKSLKPENHTLILSKSRYPLSLSKTLSTDLDDVTTELASKIRFSTGPDHQLRDASLPWNIPHCPYCLAFGLWYHHWHYGEPINLYEYLVLSEPMVLSHLVTTDHKIIRLPSNVQSILFRNEIRYSFYVIFRYVSAFILSLQKRKNRNRYWQWPSDVLNNLPQKKYSNFLFYKTNTEMITFFYVTEDIDYLELPTELQPYCDPILGDRSLYKNTNNGYYLDSIKREFFCRKYKR